MAKTVEFALSPPIERGEIRGLCTRVRELLQATDGALLVCDVAAIVAPDAVILDALARLQLTARRSGGELRLAHACGELEDLLAFAGLSEVLKTCGRSGVQVGRQPEQREHALGVKEEGDPGDLSV